MGAATGREALLSLVTRRQAGSFSAAQALEAGYSRRTIARRVETGTWERALPGVYVLAGSERTWLQHLWVAYLAVGPRGVVSHETAALIHGAEGLSASSVVLTNPHRWHHHLPGVFVHQIDDLAPSHRTRWQGLPVSTPARAVVELAATQPASVIGRVADDLIAARLTSVAAIATVFASVARPGKPGMLKLVEVLEERADGYVPPHSELERALFAALAAGGLPAPERQVPLPARGGVRGIADAAYRDALIVIEADGRRWHQRLDAAKADRARDAAAARAGWVTLRFVFEQIVHEPAELCAVVADTRAIRLRMLSAAA